METKVYNQEGKEAGSVKLPENVFGLPWNADLVHQVITSLMSSARTPVAHSRMRGEVRGGGKKPWQQKGTGRARHGSTRSPLWVGGGVTHGPRNDKNFDRKINKKMKLKALFTILSKKFKDGEVLFIDSLNFKAPKASEAKHVLDAIGGIKGFESITKKRTNAAHIALGRKDVNTEKSFRNFSNIQISETRNINPLQLVNAKFVVFSDPEASIKAIARANTETAAKTK
jgi:large subunit ribosomal protein L4